MNKIVKKWLEISDYDFETAKAMLETGRYLYVAFMCQQAIEKAIKSLITLKKETYPPKIHKLEILAFQAEIKNDLSYEQREFLSELNYYYLNNRYPDFKNDLGTLVNQEKAEILIYKTEEFLKWIKKKIK